MNVDNAENLVVGILFVLFFGGMFAPLAKSVLTRNSAPAKSE